MPTALFQLEALLHSTFTMSPPPSQPHAPILAQLSSRLSPFHPQEGITKHASQQHLNYHIETHNTTTAGRSSMPCVLTGLFPNMSPKTPVLGLYLTHETAANHLKTCLSLLSLIAHQILAIQYLDPNDLRFVSRLQSIQVRHLEFTTKLSDLVKDLAGAEDWVAELGDGLASMKGKVRMCNRSSQSSSSMVSGTDSGSGGGRVSRTERERSWSLAATVYWPLISESYITVKPLLETLRDETSDGLDILEGSKPIARTILAEYNKFPHPDLPQSPRKTKTRMGRSNSLISFFGGKRHTKPLSKPPTVHFARDVKARWFTMDEAPATISDSSVAVPYGHNQGLEKEKQKQVLMKRDHVVPLTSDRKRSAGDYKSRNAKVKNGRYGTGNGGGNTGGWIPSTAYF